MNPLITLEWTAQDSRRKLELSPTENGWERHDAHKTDTGWHHTTHDQIHKPTLTITTNWHSEDPLVASFPDPEAVVVVHPDGLRYRATRSQHWHPIDDDGLTHLLNHHGQPTLTPLSNTPFEHNEFDGDHPLSTDTTPLQLARQTGGETDG